MITLIAWRNIWRSKGRSLVVIGSIVVGIWALIFMMGFMNSFMISYINGAIKNEISHIQIHHPEFKSDFDIRYNVPNGIDIADSIEASSIVKATTARSIVNGMISSSRKAMGVKIYGVDPEREAEVTHHDSLVISGDYFQTRMRNPVVIGSELAEDLSIEVNSKVVLTFQEINQNITAGAFRVVGIVETSSPVINKGTAFVRRSDLNKILGIGNEVHEIAIFLEDPNTEDSAMTKLSANYNSLQVESWRTLAPELELFLSMMDSFLWVLTGIIMIALIFGIINSMLMAVLERFRELGMLMAVGMNKVRIFFMIVIETVFLSLVGGPIGVLLGYATIRVLENTGIDLSDYSEGLREFGYDSVLYPFVETNTYIYVTVGVIITALVGALYPAYKAIKLNPVQALHTI